MGTKICAVCNRQFSKTEHLRRHERGHTKEKPYRCPTCHKTFSRSDVLCRHVKGHARESQAVEASQDTSIGQSPLPAYIPPTSAQPQISVETSTEPNNALPSDGQTSSIATVPEWDGTQLDPLLEQSQSHHHNEVHELLISAATLSGQNVPSDHRVSTDEWLLTEGARSSASTPVLSRVTLMQTNTHVPTPERSPIPVMSHSADSDVQYNNIRPVPEHRQDNQADFSTAPFTFSTPAPDDFTDVFEFWLHQSHPDLMVQSLLRDLPVTTSGQEVTTESNTITTSNLPQSGLTSTLSAFSQIPLERFEKVQRRWHPESRRSHRQSWNLWTAILHGDRANLVCDKNDQVGKGSAGRTGRRVNDTFRQRMEAALADKTVSHHAPSTFSDQFGLQETPESLTVDYLHSSKVAVPPAEILGVGLDMYFRQFHPTLPIIHPSTFVVDDAPNSLVLAMLLVGFTILDTKGASQFVDQTFPVLLENISTELHLHSSRTVVPERLLTDMVTALLTLHVASVSGSRRRVMQVEHLYIQLLAVAQWHGLLYMKDEGLLQAEFDAMDDDHKWTAWAKIESVKRLIIGIIEIDCWFATCLSTDPCIHPETARVLPPSDQQIFEANSSQKWLKMTNNGHISKTSAMTPSNASWTPIETDPLTLRTKLTLIHLRLCHAYHKLDCEGHIRALEPWQWLLTDKQDNALVNDLLTIASAEIQAIKSTDVDCAILWHNSCMMLTANICLFELAAGRRGSTDAMAALNEIATWSQTQAARRACLHAGEIFKTLMDRRLSDTVTMHTAVALFRAALVLGLYAFVGISRTFDNQESAVDLTNHFDWQIIGGCGLVQVWTAPADIPDDLNTAAAIDFIQDGGPLCIFGDTHNTGYATARRILLHFSDLMEGLGKWKSRTFSQILQIISDGLRGVPQPE